MAFERSDSDSGRVFQPKEVIEQHIRTAWNRNDGLYLTEETFYVVSPITREEWSRLWPNWDAALKNTVKDWLSRKRMYTQRLVQLAWDANHGEYLREEEFYAHSGETRECWFPDLWDSWHSCIIHCVDKPANIDKINPFKPSLPIDPDSFIGRENELRRLSSMLKHTAHGMPMNFMITGPRGIGKTSLLGYIRHKATNQKGKSKLNLLVVNTYIENTTTQLGLVKKITEAISEKMSHQTKVKDTANAIWEFVQRIEAGGFKIKESSDKGEANLILEKFSRYLSDIAENICVNDDSKKEDKYDGILVLVDEVDTASEELQIGSFFKYLIENLSKLSCNRISFGLSGLPKMIDAMKESHPSSLRVFEELPLNNLSNDDSRKIIHSCLGNAYLKNDELVFEISPTAEELLVKLSGGHPHYLHQFGYCAFNADSDFTIDDMDVFKGATCSRGAIDILGDIYYKDLFNLELSSQQREILLVIADGQEFISIEEILKATNRPYDSVEEDLTVLLDQYKIIEKHYQEKHYKIISQAFIYWLDKEINTIEMPDVESKN